MSFLTIKHFWKVTTGATEVFCGFCKKNFEERVILQANKTNFSSSKEMVDKLNRKLVKQLLKKTWLFQWAHGHLRSNVRDLSPSKVSGKVTKDRNFEKKTNKKLSSSDKWRKFAERDVTIWAAQPFAKQSCQTVRKSRDHWKS